jgi:hypothetical protein
MEERERGFRLPFCIFNFKFCLLYAVLLLALLCLLAVRLLFLFLRVVLPPAPLPPPLRATLVAVGAPAPLAKTKLDAPSVRTRDKATVLIAFRNVDFIEKLLL